MTIMDPICDVTLVQQCVRGESAAWSRLIDRYAPLVDTVARRAGLDRHGAADVLQTVFARLFEHLPRIDHPQRLQAWIVTASKRESWLQCRRGRRTVSMTPSGDWSEREPIWELVDRTAIAEDALSQRQQIDQLRAGLCLLDGRCRDLLELLFPRDDEPLTYAEIARRLDAPVGSIGPTRSRCLDKLRRTLEEMAMPVATMPAPRAFETIG